LVEVEEEARTAPLMQASRILVVVEEVMILIDQVDKVVLVLL
jgi:hypothetical protein